MIMMPLAQTIFQLNSNALYEFHYNLYVLLLNNTEYMILITDIKKYNIRLRNH